MCWPVCWWCFAWCSFGWPGDETDESQIHPAGHGAAAGTGAPGEYAGGGSACAAKIGSASGAFATAYTALLEKAPVAQADLERDPYGLCRLVVTGYGGKDYGAVAAAVTDGLAILQYDTPLAARKAAVQLAQDGATAEAGQPVPIRDRYEPDRQPLPLGGGNGGITAFCARRRIPVTGWSSPKLIQVLCWITRRCKGGWCLTA